MASGRNFCCSIFDLLEKIFFAFLAISNERFLEEKVNIKLPRRFILHLNDKNGSTNEFQTLFLVASFGASADSTDVAVQSEKTTKFWMKTDHLRRRGHIRWAPDIWSGKLCKLCKLYKTWFNSYCSKATANVENLESSKATANVENCPFNSENLESLKATANAENCPFNFENLESSKATVNVENCPFHSENLEGSKATAYIENCPFNSESLEREMYKMFLTLELKPCVLTLAFLTNEKSLHVLNTKPKLTLSPLVAWMTSEIPLHLHIPNLKPKLAISNISFLETKELLSIWRICETLKPKPLPSTMVFWDINVTFFQISARQCQQLIVSRQMRSGDVERHPGPVPGVSRGKRVDKDVTVTSLNIRGLKDESKLRHLLNHCHKGATSTKLDCFYLLQETYIDAVGKIPYIWRGNFYLTPGEGHSGGCLTLMSSHISVIASREIEKRAHVLVCQKKGENKVSYIIVNVYAPNPNTNEKITFFEKLFEYVGELEQLYDCQNIMVVGDFNLTFKETECKNRLRTTQEKRVANCVSDMAEQAGLVDVWRNEVNFTWKRANTDCFSCIDHALFNDEIVSVSSARTNWSLSFSDHAAVVLDFILKRSKPTVRSRVVRLDPSLIKTPEIRLELETNFNEMWARCDHSWDPHTKLEYAKLCIRTVTEALQAKRKQKEVSEEDELNEELNSAINKLEKGCRNPAERNEVLRYVEELRGKKEVLIDRKGKRLAEKLGSKWYNEGEKSTRYFLRLLNRSMPDKFTELVNTQGELLQDSDRIEEEVVNFYKTLYEQYDKSHLGTNNDESFFDNITPVSDDEANGVAEPIQLAELTKTLHTCKDSAPGPDGIPYSYLGALWTTLGPLIVDAWNHSLQTGNLCASHKTSFLRLIPKAGKDLKKLTNWRPITLSNCDHKIITKTYASRLGEKVGKVIKERQTAYLKGRLINDNVRAIQMSIHHANLDDETIDGLLVSLDAKKAFDSVEHSFIENCLRKFGFHNFVGIFKTLYAGLRSDILINGKIVKGYDIKRGVKQGDALSCILFIMCMEPLITNVEMNREIETIFSRTFNASLPKAYTYADDLNCVIKRTRRGLQAIFTEYGRLTRLAGLELNADKTELMRFATDLRGVPFAPLEFVVRYLDRQYRIQTVNETKINGIFFQQDENLMIQRNVEHVKEKIGTQMEKWAGRNLSTLGKILIVKTFGVSQIVFLLQSLNLETRHFKLLNEILYKFIWNRHFRASKAPERVKREIVNTSLKNGGFGMLDVTELDNGLKLRSIGRLLDTKHPALVLLKRKINFDDYFYPKFDKKLDAFVGKGIELLERDRQSLWQEPSLRSEVKLISAIRSMKLVNCIQTRYRNSISIFLLRREGKTEIGQLSLANVTQIGRMLKDNVPLNLLEHSISLRVPGLDDHLRRQHFSRKKWIDLGKLTSKELREARSKEVPICVFKNGLLLNPSECRRWLNCLGSLRSTSHKNAILRYVHGDIYSQERLFRFGLVDTPNCETCGQLETINHKIYECNYAASRWQSLAELTGININNIDLDFVMGAYESCSKTVLTIHAELIGRLIRSTRPLFASPTEYVKMMIETLARKEVGTVKRELEAYIS